MPPDEAQRKAALDVIKDLYKGEYAKTRPVDRIALADLLLAKAREVKDNPTDRYVLLKESADPSVRACCPSAFTPSSATARASS